MNEHRMMDMLEMAWTIIANANGGNWELASPEWRKAAEEWRDGYHDILHERATPENVDSPTLAP